MHPTSPTFLPFSVSTEPIRRNNSPVSSTDIFPFGWYPVVCKIPVFAILATDNRNGINGWGNVFIEEIINRVPNITGTARSFAYFVAKADFPVLHSLSSVTFFASKLSQIFDRCISINQPHFTSPTFTLSRLDALARSFCNIKRKP